MKRRYREKKVRGVLAEQWFPPGHENHSPSNTTLTLTDGQYWCVQKVPSLDGYGYGIMSFPVSPGEWLIDNKGCLMRMTNSEFIEKYELVED